MQSQKIKLGLVGNGYMMRTEHLPYLEKRIREKNDIAIKWAGGCLCLDEETIGCPMSEQRERDAYKSGPYREKCGVSSVNDWHNLLEAEPVDGVIISLPNFMHTEAIKAALDRYVNVAVDKPTTINSQDCSQLVSLAKENQAIFVTLSQRRYEDVYKTVAEIISRDGLGEISLINYMISHEYFGKGGDSWTKKKSLAGGGALIQSGYHGIDTILWLLSHAKEAVKPKSVSARWVLDEADDAIETAAVVRIFLSNGGIFNAIASFLNPQSSLDENIKIFGNEGVVRIMRDRPRKLRGDQSAASLSYQHRSGSYCEYDTREWRGHRWAPLEDYIDAMRSKMKGDSYKVLSPAEDSILPIKLIEMAYESAKQDGREIIL
jgi:predicted dehydrogenase